MDADEPVTRSTARANGSGSRRPGAAGAGNRREVRRIPSDLSFDDALSQLEETVAALESGQLTLEESLALFEHGMHLAKHCQQVLDRAELRVKQLVVASDTAGELTIDTLEIDVE